MHPSKLAILLVFLFLLPLFSPFTSVGGEARIESNDFEILDDLNDILSDRQDLINRNTIGSLAQPKIDDISNSVYESGDSDALSNIGQGINDISLIQTSPPSPNHPDPYELAISGASRPGDVNNIWPIVVCPMNSLVTYWFSKFEIFEFLTVV